MASPTTPAPSWTIGKPRELLGRLGSERFDALWGALRKVVAVPSLLVFFLFLLSIRTANFGPFYTLAMVGLFAAAYFLMPRTDYRLFVVYFIGFAVFNGVRTSAHLLGIPVSYTYPIDVDSAVFGSVPTNWLQDRFFEFGRISALDWIAVAVYVTYFWGHFLAAGLLWVFRRDLLAPYIKLVLGVFFLGLVGYLLLPTSPPWLAAQTGHLPEVFRIAQLATSEVWADAYSQGSYVAGTNDVAAMPSLHTALTTTIALIAWRIGRVPGVLAWCYVAAMGFSLVYLGEHYVIDVLAGIALACVIWRFIAATKTLTQDEASSTADRA